MRNFKFTTKTAIALSTMLVAVIFCGCEAPKKEKAIIYFIESLKQNEK